MPKGIPTPGSASDSTTRAKLAPRRSTGTPKAPTRTVKTPAIRPAVDPMRQTVTGHSGTGSPTGGLPALDRPIKQVKQPIVRPAVDPMRQPMSMPQYSEGGFVRTPKSNFGTTDYRKTGLTKSTHVKGK